MNIQKKTVFPCKFGSTLLVAFMIGEFACPPVSVTRSHQDNQYFLFTGCLHIVNPVCLRVIMLIGSHDIELYDTITEIFDEK